MRGNRTRFGMTVARNSESRSSNANAASASVRNASMLSRRSRKLAVSSTRQTPSATLLGGPAGIGAGPALLKSGHGSVSLLRTPGLDVGQSAPGVFDQQQVDALALQPVVVIQPVGVDEGDIALTVLRDDLFFAGLGLIGQLGQIGACLGEGHHITG